MIYEKYLSINEMNICGRADMIDLNTNELIEIKASRFSSCQPRWISQALIYAVINGSKKMSVINILMGIKYEFDVKMTIEDVIKKLKS
jgi:hypothetical protein